MAQFQHTLNLSYKKKYYFSYIMMKFFKVKIIIIYKNLRFSVPFDLLFAEPLSIDFGWVFFKLLSIFDYIFPKIHKALIIDTIFLLHTFECFPPKSR